MYSQIANVPFLGFIRRFADAAAGIRNQEFWIDKALADFEGRAASFLIHVKDDKAEPWRIASIDPDRFFVGQRYRDGPKTYLEAQPQALQ